MFKFNPSRKFKQLDPHKLLKFATSVNEPQVASATHGMQTARAYVVAVKEVEGADVFIAFYFPEVGDVEYYTLPGNVAEAHVEKAFERAMDFCSSMGFVMEEMSVDVIDNTLVEQLREVCPLFHSSLEEYRSEEEEIELEESVEEEEEEEIELEDVAEEEAEEVDLEEVAEGEGEEIELEEVAEDEELSEVDEVSEGAEEEIELEEELEEETEVEIPDIEELKVEETPPEKEKDEIKKESHSKDETEGEITLRELLKKYKLIKDEEKNE